MTRDEIAARFRRGGLALAFDTNALYVDRSLIGLCAEIERCNERLRQRDLPPARLIVCAVAHVEKLFDLKQKYRDAFDFGAILDGLRSKGLEIQAFDASHARETAIRLGERYPSTEAWHQAKKQRCIRCVGLDPGRVGAPDSGQRCGATVDWLIGAHARAEGCVLVTDDSGPEFTGLADRVQFATLAAAVHEILAGPV
ncbi:hypothetical protein BE17_13155 [Sorangium cellulosum]|uniref:PIN domain-containing protein n=1 Tax=Sorangium cellulosum TaxID=56 RepID=A0A150RDB2_SORCE|nr:hypothetical protein BE17_13155 [Sorangium cellulosum]